MILDGHVHITENKRPNHCELVRTMKTAEVDGGILISLPPKNLAGGDLDSACSTERIQNLLEWCGESKNLYPFYWVDPMEADAINQVSQAVEDGIVGFKIICNCFFPGDPKAMKVYTAIAETNKPILFHSGILWDNKASSRFNRPVEFEVLINIKGLRFALAHLSWPWCDELIAVYGKFLNARIRHGNMSVEMFIDNTRGTPAVYRRDSLTKLFKTGYSVANNLLFGSDSRANNYCASYVRECIASDREIFSEINLTDDAQGAIFGENLKRFIGLC